MTRVDRRRVGTRNNPVSYCHNNWGMGYFHPFDDFIIYFNNYCSNLQRIFNCINMRGGFGGIQFKYCISNGPKKEV